MNNMNYFDLYNVPSYRLGSKGILSRAAEFGRYLKSIFNTTKGTSKSTVKKNAAKETPKMSDAEVLKLKNDFINHMDEYGFAVNENNDKIIQLTLEAARTNPDAIIPLKFVKNSRGDLYQRWMRDNFELSPDLKNFYLDNPNVFDNADGTFHADTRIAKINPATKEPIPTAVHEAISHPTDYAFENWLEEFKAPVNYAAVEGNRNYIKELETLEDYYNYMLKSLGVTEDKILKRKLTQDSEYPDEFRSTLNEAREKIFTDKKTYPKVGKETRGFFNQMKDEELLDRFFDANWYGQSYKSFYDELSPAKQKAFVENLRKGMMYLPAVSIPLLINNE